jgi:phosphoribosylformylglycinamidine synthase
LPPKLDMSFERRVHEAVRTMVVGRAVDCAHDLADGGLGWALAESCFGHGIGADIELHSTLRPEQLLFHEGPSRVLVATDSPEQVIALATQFGVPAMRIGTTRKGSLSIRNQGQLLIETGVATLRERWATALEGKLHAGLHA